MTGTRELSRWRELCAASALPPLRRELSAARASTPHEAQGPNELSPDALSPDALSPGFAAEAAVLLLGGGGGAELDGGLVRGLRRLAHWGAGVRQGLGPPALRDPSGEARDVYLPLTLHLHLAAYAHRFERLSPAAWAACDDALPDALALTDAAQACADYAPAPPLRTLTLWRALCIAQWAVLSRRDVDLELADAIVQPIVLDPGPEGSLHPRFPYDAVGPGSREASLDVWTYRELSGLHALASLALLRRNRAWARRVEEVAQHHARLTQPDYTTSQPWGLFAFVWSAGTSHFAEQQLHDATSYGSAQGPAGEVGLVAGLLLADAAHCLGQFASGAAGRP